MSATQRSYVMSRVHSKDTQPELALRRALHAAGYRFRLYGALPRSQLSALKKEHREIRLRGDRLPGSPDLVFSARNKVIFVNGCFWHGHDCPAGKRQPTSNTEYWFPKLQATIVRDQRNRLELETLGWEALTLWECELKQMDDVLCRAIHFLGAPRNSQKY
ncbi:very short patch repair endonuclease [Glutamicibacter soli]|nr:very short patch repair endonuclease [Glutamicibacter soli]